jgi:hypothetical protein
MAHSTSGCDEHCDELDVSPRLRFDDVLRGEYEELHLRRRNARVPDEVAIGRPRKLRALSLSGGGIRSATFNLGLLQALHAAGKLASFDYLSTVSGGGYLGGWLSAWLARPERRPGEVFPPPEQIELERDDRRAAIEAGHASEHFERRQVNDSAISAGSDPIHHLRLFSNFLTPHKGLLSADTWRAISVIGRNLVLTWLILLPIMLAVIMLGQSWFALGRPTAKSFLWRPDLSEYVTSAHDSGTLLPDAPPVERKSRDAGDLKRRLIWALFLPALLLVGSALCISLWMVANRSCWRFRDVLVVVLGGFTWLILTWFLAEILDIDIHPAFLIAVVVWFVVLFVVLAIWQHRHDATADDIDFWKSRLVKVQTSTLKWAVFVAVVLLFAAFGHEFIDFLLFNQTLQSEVMGHVARAGGWGAVAMAVVSSIYTALKASPTGGEDAAGKKKQPGLLEKLAFALAPPLLLIVLSLVLAWCGHRLYTEVFMDTNDEVWFAVRGTLISGLLFLVFALYEFRPPQKWKALVVITVWLAISIGQYYLPMEPVKEHLVTFGGVAAIIVGVALAARAFFTRKVPVILGASALAGLGFWLVRHYTVAGVHFVLQRSHVPQLIIGGLLCTLSLLVFELVTGRGANERSLGLMAGGFLMFVLLGAAACTGTDAAWRAMAMVGCISSILGWVLSLGWLADPNSLTVHGFYKARLVRAYMGASNERRGAVSEADITDSVPGDDVLLVDLKNSEQGAPYHLIGTTLNLVGGRDLATQQRFSDSFTMSKRFIGSTRTGYRATHEYACGTISLGTAVSVSGAAASPNMGAQTPSAALAALLTLFNVRLGYWAPTPNRSYWRTGASRLWPVYTLQELLSQTTDLLPYCYLTDGGHFDNSGAYQLVQRGCNFIVYSDCGADPEVTLDDIGNLIRKVRIDFGTEIVLENIDAFRCDPPKTHFISGRIKYSAAHAAAIGLPPDECEGTIVIVKPNRTPGATADVLQYGYTNPTYPQQTTADQWYDEAQFESYRKLGEWSAKALIAAGVV